MFIHVCCAFLYVVDLFYYGVDDFVVIFVVYVGNCLICSTVFLDSAFSGTHRCFSRLWSGTQNCYPTIFYMFIILFYMFRTVLYISIYCMLLWCVPYIIMFFIYLDILSYICQFVSPLVGGQHLVGGQLLCQDRCMTITPHRDELQGWQIANRNRNRSQNIRQVETLICPATLRSNFNTRELNTGDVN